MNQINSFFNYQGQDLRTIMVNEEIWFVAKDVCSILDLSDVSKAVSRLESDEKGTTIIPTLGGNQTLLTVNEFGLYSLILTSRKQEAKEFKRWITHDVIPSIRKTGSYSTEKVVPLSKDQALVTVLRTTADLVEDTQAIKEEQHEIRKLVTQIDNKIEEQITLTSGEQRRLQKGVATKIYEITEDQQERSRLFRELYREIKDRFAVASYKDIKRKELLSALRYIENWIPRKVS
ncbi:BRO family protein [Schinkia azotoformans]|uniref:BRO family protein n=1 Tax=Schinkia azotoformans TaxID=1454 RepID=UPI002DB80225|nr:BRO family protein [Schinkia azotoformans]MEC1714710.1 BRO family protein [Schinkia azotoformans]MEC1757534.1 BRO family protein [Schinkia azotoformans]